MFLRCGARKAGHRSQATASREGGDKLGRRPLGVCPSPWRLALACCAVLSAPACQLPPQNRSLLIKLAQQIAHDLKRFLGRGRVSPGRLQPFDERALQHQAQLGVPYLRVVLAQSLQPRSCRPPPIFAHLTSPGSFVRSRRLVTHKDAKCLLATTPIWLGRLPVKMVLRPWCAIRCRR